MNFFFRRPVSEVAVCFKGVSYSVGTVLELAERVKGQLLVSFSRSVPKKILVPTSHPVCFLAGMIGCWLANCTAIPMREDQDAISQVDYSYASPDALLAFDQNGNCAVDRFDNNKPVFQDFIGDVILTTTGSTGHPKGVVLMMSQLILNACLSADAIGLKHLTGWAIETDLGLTSGFCHLLMAWVAGVPLTYLRNASVNAKKVFFSQKGVGYGGAPIQALRLVDELVIGCAPEVVMTSGDFLTEPMLEKIRRRFSTTQVYKCYGLTELAGRFCIMPSQLLELALSAVGYPLPGFDIQVVNDAGGVCEPNELGSIFVRSPLIMQGYLRKTGFEQINAREWFNTNDLGLVDNNNLVHLYGRGNDSFKVGGEKVDRFTIEKALSGILSEFDYCVLPTEHDVLGFVPVLYVSKSKNSELLRWRSILSYLRDKLPKNFIPMRGRLLDSMPRMANGKLDRKRVVAAEAVDMEW